MNNYDAIVIGAGHNGLVTAAYLAKSGLSTVVLERSSTPGGCAATEELWPGYHVDTGAHSFTGIDQRVLSDLQLSSGELEILSPDPVLISPQHGRRTLTLHHEPAKSAQSIQPFSDRDAARWPEFLEAMSLATRVLEVLYETLPPRLAKANKGDLWELARLAGRLGRVGRKDALELMRLIPMTVEELLDEWFESDALKGTLATSGITGICQGPMASGTAYLLLHSLVGGGGVVRHRSQLRGGMRALGTALQQAAVRFGAEVRLSSPVASIRIKERCATGVSLESGEDLEARVVVSSIDPAQTFLRLIDPTELNPEFVRAVKNIKYRGVCAKVHLALDDAPVFGRGEGNETQNAVLQGASIIIAPSIEYLERAYDDAKYGESSKAPYVDAVVTTALDPSLAPEGNHILSAVVQYAPFKLKTGNWGDSCREILRDSVINTLSTYAPNLRDTIIHCHVLTPADIADRFALTEGNIYQGEMTLDQIFMMRPAPGWGRYQTPVEGLYLCGASAHPGGGLTARPGMAAARVILSHSTKNR